MKSGNSVESCAREISGVIVPIFTPVNGEERVDEGAYRRLIRHCLSAGVDGIFAGGSAGMGPLLEDDQWERAMEIAHSEVGGAVPLLGGVITVSTRKAVERIHILDRIGYQAMAVTPTYYISLTREEEFISHFEACRNATDMEMVVYNIPSCVGSNIPPKVIEATAELGWSSSCKESSGDRAYFEEVMAIGVRTGMCILQGNEVDIAWGLAIGAGGCVPVCANFIPAPFVEIWKEYRANGSGDLEKYQKEINEIRESLLLGDRNWIAGISYGMSAIGIGRGNVIAPLQRLSSAEQDTVDKLKARYADYLAEIAKN